MISWLIVILAVVVIDQVSKTFVLELLADVGSVDVIPGVFRLTYVENRGMAFGLLAEHRWVFIVISVLAICAMLAYLWKFRPDSVLACTALSMIIGGGIGNMIDRIRLEFVVDFIDFCAFPDLWKWVFNVADAFVCVGAGLLILWLILSTVEEQKQKKKAAEGAACSEGAVCADGENEVSADGENEVSADVAEEKADADADKEE